jgi:hypothetical protein
MMRYDPKAPDNISIGPPYDRGDCGCPWPTRRDSDGNLVIVGPRTCRCASMEIDLDGWLFRRSEEEVK